MINLKESKLVLKLWRKIAVELNKKQCENPGLSSEETAETHNLYIFAGYLVARFDLFSLDKIDNKTVIHKNLGLVNSY